MARHDDTSWRQLLYSKIGAAIRMRRNAAGLSGRHVAERLGVAPQSVLAYEDGGNSIPLHFLVAFSQLVGCTVNDLLPTDVPATFTRIVADADA